MNFSGEYYLTGVHEMGCGIKLNADYTFEFFFAYGALDRHGYGNWTVNEQNEVILNSNYAHQIPFTIIAEEKRSIKGIQVGFPNYNKALLNETTIKVFASTIEEEQVAGSNGFFNFNSATIDKMIVTCLFYYDNPATLIPTNSSNNYFELAANQNLALVHFNNNIFKANGETLNGVLHIFDDTKVMEFVK